MFKSRVKNVLLPTHIDRMLILNSQASAGLNRKQKVYTQVLHFLHLSIFEAHLPNLYCFSLDPLHVVMCLFCTISAT